MIQYVQRHRYPKRKASMAGMGYDGRYRCCECKRRVAMDVSDETYERDLEMAPMLEPPYPNGWCGPTPDEIQEP